MGSEERESLNWWGSISGGRSCLCMKDLPSHLRPPELGLNDTDTAQPSSQILGMPRLGLATRFSGFSTCRPFLLAVESAPLHCPRSETNQWWRQISWSPDRSFNSVTNFPNGRPVNSEKRWHEGGVNKRKKTHSPWIWMMRRRRSSKPNIAWKVVLASVFAITYQYDTYSFNDDFDRKAVWFCHETD